MYERSITIDDLIDICRELDAMTTDLVVPLRSLEIRVIDQIRNQIERLIIDMEKIVE